MSFNLIYQVYKAIEKCVPGDISRSLPIAQIPPIGKTSRAEPNSARLCGFLYGKCPFRRPTFPNSDFYDGRGRTFRDARFAPVFATRAGSYSPLENLDFPAKNHSQNCARKTVAKRPIRHGKLIENNS